MPDEPSSVDPDLDAPSRPVSLLHGVADRWSFTPGRVVAGVGAAVVALAVGWWLLRPPAPAVESTLPMATVTAAGDPSAVPTEVGTASTTSVPTEMVVHTAGAVARPGLYHLAVDARVADAVDAAGGLAPDADGSRLNLAAPLADGERIYVPRIGEAVVPPAVNGDGAPAPATPGGSAGEGPTAPVDLNTATAEELDGLPGVGPATAEAIIAYRIEHGRFTSVDELLDVRGIGDAKLAELRGRVRV